MSEYLKMADVFCGNVSTKLIDEECINEMANGDGAGNYHVLQDDAYWVLIDEDQAKYAAHAINSHDALVAQRDELLEAIDAAIDCGIVPSSSAKDGGAAKYARQVIVADQIREAIAKAKVGAL